MTKEIRHTDLQIPTEFADKNKERDLRIKSQIRVMKKLGN